MKKFLVSLTAIVGAIGFSAFSAKVIPPDDVWFLTSVTGVPRTDLAPTIDKPICPGESLNFCAKRYTSYQVNAGVYTPGSYMNQSTEKE